MPFYAAPGIYVEEVPGGARPIGAVGTSTAAFVGTAPDAGARLNEAVAVNSWSGFVRTFASQATSATPLALAVFGFFENGGGRCYVVNTEEGAPIAGRGTGRSGLRVLEAIDEIAIVAAPGAVGPDPWDAILTHCEKLEDRVGVLDLAAEVDDVERLTRVATAAPAPATTSRRGQPAPPAEGDAAAEAEGSGGATTSEPGEQTGGERPRKSAYGACYFPHLKVRDPFSGELVSAPPSGHMAGIWARTDMTRGVHKAPANEIVRGALDLTYGVTREEQALLNPEGVNCIRYFPGSGITVWGARTLDEDEWRYLNVRRLFNMLKESIAEGTNWIVFEPNDYILWRSIVRDITAFLTRVWRDGALFGRTPQEAFFVQCDAETNPPEVRDAGQVVAIIGVAPVKPAEFVVFKLSQTAGGTAIETIGG